MVKLLTYSGGEPFVNSFNIHDSNLFSSINAICYSLIYFKNRDIKFES